MSKRRLILSRSDLGLGLDFGCSTIRSARSSRRGFAK